MTSKNPDIDSNSTIEIQNDKVIVQSLTIKSDTETDYTISLNKLINTFNTKYYNNYIIPCGKDKQPTIAHKNNSYNWKNFNHPDITKRPTFIDKGNVGIILKDLIVLDIDDKTLSTNWETMFPVLKTVVSETTRKGKHYYFKRTDLTDTYRIVDKAKCLLIDGIKPPFDIKTICSTGTGGIIICAPSPGKEWVISPYSKEIQDIPENLLNYINGFYIGNSISNPKEEKISKKDQKEIRITKEFKDVSRFESDNIEELLNMLSESRINNYSDWMEVGFCLYNIGKIEGDNEKYYNLFDKWSQKGTSYDKKKNDKIWNNIEFRKDGFNIGSLKRWANIDNEFEYKLYKKKNLKGRLYTSIYNKMDLCFAEAFYYYFPNKYINVNKDDIYVFKKHYWKKEGDDDLYNDLVIELPKEYLKISEEIEREIEEIEVRIKQKFINSKNGMDMDNSETIEELNEKIQTKALVIEEIRKAINCLCDTTKIEKIKKAILRKYTTTSLFDIKSEDFINQLNTKDNLLCFENGVYNLDTKKFREGKPDDLLTMSCKINYTSKRDPEVYDEIMKFLYEITDSEEMLEYLIKLCASFLHGYKAKEVMYFWNGNSRNGKGCISKLLKYSMGNYYKELKPGIFCMTNNTGFAASPDLAEMEGRRVVMITEIKKGHKLQVDDIKRMVGKDDISARGLFQNLRNFDSRFALVGQCNDYPELSKYEAEFCEKIEFLKFPYHFVPPNKFDPTKKNHKLMDLTIKHKFITDRRYAQQFMLILLENYVGTEYTVPQFVIDMSKEYLESNNELAIWLKENFDTIDISDRKEKHEGLKRDEVFRQYERDNRNVIISKKNFYINMSQNMSSYKFNGWDRFPIKFKSEESRNLFRNETEKTDSEKTDYSSDGSTGSF